MMQATIGGDAVFVFGVWIIIGIIVTIRLRNSSASRVSRMGLERYVEPIIPRDDVFYRRAVDSIPATDRMIHHLRSPLAAGMVEEWNKMKEEFAPLPESNRTGKVTRAMRTARRIDRMSWRVAVLAAAENGDEDARLTIVDDLLEDLFFAYETCSLDDETRVPIRDGIAAVTRRARALKGDLASPQFFQHFMGICSQYAAVMRDARPVLFRSIMKAIDETPPVFSEELWVFGTGIDGLVPWMHAYAVKEYVDYRSDD